MKEKQIEIKSKGRRVFKLIVVFILIIMFFVIYVNNKNTDNLWFSAILGFIALFELVTYGQTTLTLTSAYLNVKYSGFLLIMNNNLEIDLTEIQSSFYKRKKYDNMGLMHRFFWELFFPSGHSYLTINKTNGKSVEISFYGNEENIIKLKEMLPERIPNN